MTTTADRHRVLRTALTAAIRLTGIVSRGQTAALTAAVWRVVEPALAQRDAQLDAVREVVAAMGGITGAGFWAEQLRAALRPQPPAAAGLPLSWCAASMPGVGGKPVGPCVLRAGHDGPVHQSSTGARWWNIDGGMITIPETLTEQESEAFRAAWNAHHQRGEHPPTDWATVPLTVKVYGPTPRPCPSGRHIEHPGDSCEEADSDATTWTQFLQDLYQRAMADTAAKTDRVPAPLRGPNAPPPAGDPAPLRRIAEQAVGEQQPRFELRGEHGPELNWPTGDRVRPRPHPGDTDQQED